MRRGAREDGYLLIEVLVGTVLVALVTLALLSAFDSSTQASASNKQRSLASDVAQHDQEQLRAMSIDDLRNLSDTKTVTEAGVNYTVGERADWVSDNSGVVSCTNTAGAASYLEVTSTVTWPGMKIQPVILQSLIAPQAGSFLQDQGTIIVNVEREDPLTGNRIGVPGVDVSLGTGSYDDITDQNGCAVFGYIPSGTYNVTATRPGLVDAYGNSPGTFPNCAAPDGASQTCTLLMDQAADISTRFQTNPYNQGVMTTWGPAVTFLQPEMQNTGGLRTINAPSSTPDPTTSQRTGLNSLGAVTYPNPIDAPTMFPFSNGYSAFPGTCAHDNPTDPTVANEPDYYNFNPGKISSTGPAQSYSLTVNEPALNVTALDSSGGISSASDNQTLYITDTQCGVTYQRKTQAGAWGGAHGRIWNPGFPMSTYTICREATFGVTVRNAQVSISNTPPSNNVLGGVPANINVPAPSSSSAAGKCPGG